jgi:hypothetical protein
MTENQKKTLFLSYFMYTKIQQKLPFLKIFKNRYFFFFEYLYLIQKQLIFKEIINIQNFADLLEFRNSYIALPLKKVPLELTFLYLTGGSSLKENLSFTEMGYNIYNLQKKLDQKTTFYFLHLKNYNNMKESLNMLILNDLFQKKKTTSHKNFIRYFLKTKKIIFYPKKFLLHRLKRKKKRIRLYQFLSKKRRIKKRHYILYNKLRKIKVEKKTLYNFRRSLFNKNILSYNL